MLWSNRSFFKAGLFSIAYNLFCRHLSYLFIRSCRASYICFQITDFDWSPQTQGILLGAFFWGYACTQLPGGNTDVIMVISFLKLHFLCKILTRWNCGLRVLQYVRTLSVSRPSNNMHRLLVGCQIVFFVSCDSMCCRQDGCQVALAASICLASASSVRRSSQPSLRHRLGLDVTYSSDSEWSRDSLRLVWIE